MAHLVHDVLIKLVNGTELQDSLTDEEAFLNIKAGNSLFISKCNGFFVFGNSKSAFTRLTSHSLRQFQIDSPDLVIEITSCESVLMDVTDIHEFETFTIPTPPPPPPPPPTPIVITTNMVSQSLGVWKIESDRVIGEILFIANSTFPNFLLGQNIKTFINIVDSNNVTIGVKENTLNFTATERDERIFYNESAFGNQFVKIQTIVTSPDNQAMAKAITFDVTTLPTIPPPTTTTKSKWAILPFALISALLITDGLRRKGR